MSSNKRIRRSPRTTKSLVAETKPKTLGAADLKREVHRLEVEIVSAHRFAAERQQQGSGHAMASARSRGFGSQQRLTYAQARKRRARWMMQVGMFLTSTCLLAGAGAWLYRFWQSVN